MRKSIILFFLVSLTTPVVADSYPDTVVLLLNHLDLSEQQKRQGALAGLKNFGWIVDSKTANPLVGDLKGLNKTKVSVEIGTDNITIKHLTEQDLENYKFYRRLLNLGAIVYWDMLECTHDTYKLNPPKTDLVRKMRAAVYAIARYKWHISEITESKIVSSLPARGRLEATIDNGTVTFKHWSEIEEAYVVDDGYVRRVKRLYDMQVSDCAL